jgi:hypothetical protein
MPVGYKLRRMIRDGAPSEWSPLMRLVASEIADDAHDPGQDKDPLPSPGDWPDPWSAMPIEGGYRHGDWKDGMVERCGMSARAVSRTLADLAEAGYDMRAPITDRDGKPVRDRRGRLVYAAKRHAVRFTVPHLPPRGKPQSSPEVASNGTLPTDDQDRSPDSASIGDQGAGGASDWESLPDSASIEAQRSPLLVPKVATFGDPVSSASPNVKTVPQAAAPRLAEDQDQDPGALRLPQVANSKPASSRLNDQQVADDAPHFSANDAESTTTGTGARARRTDTSAA